MNHGSKKNSDKYPIKIKKIYSKNNNFVAWLFLIDQELVPNSGGISLILTVIFDFQNPTPNLRLDYYKFDDSHLFELVKGFM